MCIPITEITEELNLEEYNEKIQNSTDIEHSKTIIHALGSSSSLLKILHLNICSANMHFDELLLLLDDCKLQDIDVIVLSETWQLTNEQCMNQVSSQCKVFIYKL